MVEALGEGWRVRVLVAWSCCEGLVGCLFGLLVWDTREWRSAGTHVESWLASLSPNNKAPSPPPTAPPTTTAATSADNPASNSGCRSRHFRGVRSFTGAAGGGGGNAGGGLPMYAVFAYDSLLG